MKYAKTVYERLVRGGFICRDSFSKETVYIFRDIEDNTDEYRDYFSQIGLILEEGEGYYYFSRKEKKVTLTDKLSRFGHWIDMLDFVKAWDSTFGPGYQFTLAQLLMRMENDVDLSDKSRGLYDNKERFDDIAERFIDEMCDRGYLDCVDERLRQYRVLASLGYLEGIVEMLDVYDNDDDNTADDK